MSLKYQFRSWPKPSKDDLRCVIEANVASLVRQLNELPSNERDAEVARVVAASLGGDEGAECGRSGSLRARCRAAPLRTRQGGTAERVGWWRLRDRCDDDRGRNQAEWPRELGADLVRNVAGRECRSRAAHAAIRKGAGRSRCRSASDHTLNQASSRRDPRAGPSSYCRGSARTWKTAEGDTTRPVSERGHRKCPS